MTDPEIQEIYSAASYRTPVSVHAHDRRQQKTVPAAHIYDEIDAVKTVGLARRLRRGRKREG